MYNDHTTRQQRLAHRHFTNAERDALAEIGKGILIFLFLAPIFWFALLVLGAWQDAQLIANQL